MKLADPQSITSNLQGSVIQSGSSSLNQFAIKFKDGKALLIRAVDKDGVPAIDLELVPSDAAKFEEEAVCRVDWSWICQSSIEEATATQSVFRLKLSPAGPLTISVQVWQGSPFLAFQPYRPAK